MTQPPTREEPTVRAPRRVAVIGASGFVGGAVARAVSGRGAEVVPVAAPRLRTTARDAAAVVAALPAASEDVERLAQALSGADVVVNAAGVASATAAADDDLFGANALLPLVVVVAAREAGVRRVVQVSSAAVQGRTPVLTESATCTPFSPYSASKAVGEVVASSAAGATLAVVLFRPTSVQGRGRGVTRSLVRLLGSPLSSVAGPGTRPTPQVHVDNVGDAVAFVALTGLTPPPVVLQPSELMSTGELAQLLGGRDAHSLPMPLARGIVALTGLVGRASGSVAGVSRRLEMLWLGQDQAPSWLDSVGWRPVAGRDEWKALR